MFSPGGRTPPWRALATAKKAECGSAFSFWPRGDRASSLLGSSTELKAPMASEWSVTAMKSSGQARRAGTSLSPTTFCCRPTWLAGTITVSPRPNL